MRESQLRERLQQRDVENIDDVVDKWADDAHEQTKDDRYDYPWPFPKPKPQPQKLNIMDKNLSALLREDAFTLVVFFQGFTNPYTYLSLDKSLAVGDHVVVPNVDKQQNERLSIAVVQEVHDTVKIEPNDEVAYKWVVQKVDSTAYKAIIEGNKLITEAARQAYQANAKRSYRNQIMAGMDAESQNALLAVINGASTLLANKDSAQG